MVRETSYLGIKSKVKLLPLKELKEFTIPDFDDLAENSCVILEKETVEFKAQELSVNDPANFNEFVGQEPQKKVLKIIIDAAKKTKTPLPNILITGTFGHGKTTLGKLISKTYGASNTRILDGASAEVLLTTRIEPNTIYVVDEIHNINAVLADSLNILLDSQQLRLIGCTTSPGKLSAPFRSRFRQIYLDDYSEKEIEKIIYKSAKRSNTKIEQKAAEIIAIRSKLNPRLALSILDFLREFLVVKNIASINVDLALEALDFLRIDEKGLNELDRKYLDSLNYLNPVGLRHIMAVMAVDGETIEEEIEPFLLKIGLVERTSRGRIKRNVF